jgi:sulfite exporter TauE/SafE
MDAALAASAFLMGLAGTPHCAAMCGAACGALAPARPGDPGTRRRLALHAARILSYSLAGALVAASVAGIAVVAHARMLQPVWTLFHVAAIAFGLWLLWSARTPAWFGAAPARLERFTGSSPVRFVRRLPPSGRAGLAGLAWVALPCGLLQSALVVAALASSALSGALVMAAFATASAIGLWLGPAAWHFLRRGGRNTGAGAGSVAIRLAGLLLAGSSLFAVWHGLGAAIDAICAVAA